MRAGFETRASSSLEMLRLVFQKSITRSRKVFDVSAIRKSEVCLTGPWMRTRKAKIVCHICTVKSGQPGIAFRKGGCVHSTQ